MNDNSLKANQINIEQGNYKNASERIIAILKDKGAMTMHDVAKEMGVQINRISGRFRTLVWSGQAEIVDKIKIGKFNYSIYKAT